MRSKGLTHRTARTSTQATGTQQRGKGGVALRLTMVKPADPVGYVVSKNLIRRQLTIGQRAMVAARVREIFDERAKERMSEGGVKSGKTRRGEETEGVAKLPPLHNARKARDEAGKALGVGGRTVDADHPAESVARGLGAGRWPEHLSPIGEECRPWAGRQEARGKAAGGDGYGIPRTRPFSRGIPSDSTRIRTREALTRARK